jgi:hypothetical protein
MPPYGFSGGFVFWFGFACKKAFEYSVIPKPEGWSSCCMLMPEGSIRLAG